MFKKIDTIQIDETLNALNGAIRKYRSLNDRFKKDGNLVGTVWQGFAGPHYRDSFCKSRFNLDDQIAAIEGLRNALHSKYSYYKEADMAGGDMFSSMKSMFPGKKQGVNHGKL